MSSNENYFLRQWTVQSIQVDGKPSPYKTPESVEPGYAYRFHRQDGRIVCQPIGSQQNGRDAWSAAAFVYDPDHDRLLGMVVLGGMPHILEITRWNHGKEDWIQCGYVKYEHKPHGIDDIYHLGVWHGTGN